MCGAKRAHTHTLFHWHNAGQIQLISSGPLVSVKGFGCSKWATIAMKEDCNEILRSLATFQSYKNASTVSKNEEKTVQLAIFVPTSKIQYWFLNSNDTKWNINVHTASNSTQHLNMFTTTIVQNCDERMWLWENNLQILLVFCRNPDRTWEASSACVSQPRWHFDWQTHQLVNTEPTRSVTNNSRLQLLDWTINQSVTLFTVAEWITTTVKSS